MARFFVQNTSSFCKMWIMTFVFRKNVNFSAKKLVKIA
jgi:hypothetical protein